MFYFLVFLSVFLLIGIIYLLFRNSQIKKLHHANMQKLQSIIVVLHEKQLLLNDKVVIVSDYNIAYKNDMKTLVDTIVELQKVFVEIISNKK